MKQIKIALAALVALLTCLSCSIEEEVYDRYVVSDYYSSELECNNAVLGIYSRLYEYNNYKSQYSQMIIGFEDMFCTGAPSTTLGISSNKHLTPSSVNVENSWGSMYQIVVQSNMLLEYMKEDVFVADDTDEVSAYDRFKGEAYFMRAWAYFTLVRTYGEIPISTTATTYKSDFNLPRSSVADVYERIFEDFKMASDLLPTRKQQPTDEYGRATKGAADGYLALANLTYANYLDLNAIGGSEPYYTAAAEYADAVIDSKQYTLVPNYADLWDADKELSVHPEEMIFAIHYIHDMVATTQWRGSEFAHRMVPYNSSGLSFSKGDAQGFGVHPLFYDMYTKGLYEGDYRTEASFIYEWENAAGEKYEYNPTIVADGTTKTQTLHVAKYIDGDGLSIRNHDNNLSLMRYAEIYMIKAEALNELNKIDEAIASFNKLRERARLADGEPRLTPRDLTFADLETYSSEHTTKTRMREIIFHERGLEFVGEFIRFFDLARMRRGNGIPYAQYMHKDFIPNYGKIEWKTGAMYNPYITERNIETWSEKYLLAPIPQSEIDVNTELTSTFDQNYGW